MLAANTPAVCVHACSWLWSETHPGEALSSLPTNFNFSYSVTVLLA